MPVLRDNGLSPAVAFGFKANDGILLAYLPAGIGEKDCHQHAIPSWPDAVLFIAGDDDRRLGFDIMPPDDKPVKWWKVKNACREARVNMPEPVWHGPAADLTQRSLEDIMRRFNAASPGEILHIRAYDRGPWINMEVTE